TGGELLGTANVTLANPLALTETFTIAAAHGTTLELNGSGWTLNETDGGTAFFGAAGQDGTVLWHTNGGFAVNAPSGGSLPAATVEVQAGTLKGADASFSILFGDSATTIVDAGAKIDINGSFVPFVNLSGGGTVTDSGAAATVTLQAVDFAGVISGAIGLDIADVAGSTTAGATLSGTNTYTGTTKIESGQTLTLGNGGTTGSVLGASAIDDEGTLTINHSNAVTLSNAISGAGTLDQKGTGTTTINHANSYSGGTTIFHGTLAVGDGGALGGGIIAFAGGELLATADETLANTLSTLFSADTIAAAHGKTLNLGAGGAFVHQARLTFGAAGQDGTVVWQATSGNTTNTATSVEVAAGTLKAGADGLSTLLSGAGTTTVDAGATLDLNGYSTTITNLHGAGTIANSGAGVTFFVGGGDFSGTVEGSTLGLGVTGATTFSGAVTLGLGA
ncbi:MAG TPA: autotransporter-associated beta strand repeat-containing protein, partial [Thermomicrobiales bacterium]|nr:autotransporter-associated beta strand repeat-containing protein [Thermomicrobiales bacterium]